MCVYVNWYILHLYLRLEFDGMMEQVLHECENKCSTKLDRVIHEDYHYIGEGWDDQASRVMFSMTTLQK